MIDMADMKADVQEFDIVDSSVDAESDQDMKRREARVVRKIDLYLMPTLLILMLLGFLDRGNIGFAASQGMIKDIGLKGKQLNVSRSCRPLVITCGKMTMLSSRIDCCVDLLRFLHSGRGTVFSPGQTVTIQSRHPWCQSGMGFGRPSQSSLAI